MVSLAGNTVGLTSDVTSPKVSEGDSRAAVESYVTGAYEGATDVLVDEPSDDALVYYSFDANGTAMAPVLAWQTSAAYTVGDTYGLLDVIVSAEDTAVLRARDAVSYVSLPGYSGDVNINIDDYAGDGTSTPLSSTVLTTPLSKLKQGRSGALPTEDPVKTTIDVYQPRTDAGVFDFRAQKQNANYWWYQDVPGSYPYAQRVMERRAWR